MIPENCIKNSVFFTKIFKTPKKSKNLKKAKFRQYLQNKVNLLKLRYYLLFAERIIACFILHLCLTFFAAPLYFKNIVRRKNESG